MKNLNAIIIEENLTAAKDIKKIIENQCPYITICDMGVNPIDTEKIIYNTLYDIIILSFKSGMDYAFELLQKAKKTIKHKELILISTEKERSLQSITNTAVDFIARPLAPNRVTKAIEKAKKHITERKGFEEIIPAKINLSKPLNLLAIPSVNEVKILKVDDILYLKSDGKYTSFSTDTNKTIVSSTNLGEYEKKLENNNFFRIHNSFLINMDNIINVHKKDGVYVEMNNHDMIPVAKRKKDTLFQFLGIK